jgi:hypothetical protein
MKQIFFSLACILILFSCNNATEATKQPEVVAIDTPAMVGNDADNHGCKGSAGFTWSQLKNDCIRTWEIGTMLNPISAKQEDMNIISVVFADDKSKAELFILDVKGTVLLNKTKENIFANSDYQLAKQNGKWELSKKGVAINRE